MAIQIISDNFCTSLTSPLLRPPTVRHFTLKNQFLTSKPGVNFIIVFCTNVLFGIFSSYVLALSPKFCTKNARVNVDEIETWKCEMKYESTFLCMKKFG